MEGTDRSHFLDLARAVIEDPFVDAAPRGLNPKQTDGEAVFEEMW